MSATGSLSPTMLRRPLGTLNAFLSLLLVILGAQFSCGHKTTCTSTSTCAIANEIGGKTKPARLVKTPT